MKETKEFQAESKELLNLMINSIYTNKEIFLRELISNASDAIDKYKYLQLTSEGKLPNRDYEIWITPNKEEKSLEISDNGIGMTKDELINNLGTIAKSGSKDFLSKFKDVKTNKDLNIIGQFGVGFYSAFMVSTKIEVTTKTTDGKAYKFTSDGLKDYTIEDADKKDAGTSIKLFLKEDKEEENYSKFLDTYTIENLVTKYSDYIRYPIKMEVTTSVPKKDKDGKEIKDQYEDKKEIKVLNSMIPLWKKNKKDVTEKDMNDFYKSKFGDYEDPLTSLFINVDGMVRYDALVYIPKHAPYNLYSENYEKGLDLYSKGIFIQEKCKALVPDYLKFVKGLVDSDDFDLNISRETLQTSPLLKRISDNIEKKVLEKLNDIKEKEYDKYLEFWKNFGDHIKFGIYESYGGRKDSLQGLLIFNSLLNEKLISLKEYKDKMKPDQKFIYYASGKTLEEIKLLPQIERFNKDGIDVLLLDKKIDEFCIMMLKDFDKVEFKNISDENSTELSKEEKENLDSLVATNKRMIDNLKEGLKGKVDDVTFSSKLIDSPVCITTKNGMSLNMENTLHQEAKDNNFTDDEVKATKVLEINPNGDLFKAFKAIEGDDEATKKYATVLYDEAMMLEGYDVQDKKAFCTKLNELLVKALNK
ncbi:MAG: molecular chaperone HtpG [Erysipelotrichaceae bacterium]|nr:molecular chaperone HtpG [Erysipelotrichaceae bacterium]MCB9499800.1 molecular chaperone HtpG [Erysipelotrichaceae bacterium]